MKVFVLVAGLLAGCGASTAGMSGPSISGRLADTSEEAPALQSNDILGRDAVTRRAVVKHILVGWRDLAAGYQGSRMDPRGAARSRADADALAEKLLARVRAGEDMEALMAEFSEDAGSAKSGQSYDVTAEEKLVFEFKRLSLRLQVGEAGLVQSSFGWHVIKRFQ
jgi:hypothetical protein